MCIRDSLKDLPETILSTKQNTALVNLGYRHNSNTISSLSQLSFRSHQQNFYGLRDSIQDPITLSNIDPKQQLNYLSVQSQWQWYASVLKKAAITAHLTTDNFNTNELELKLDTKFQVALGSIAISAEPSLRYLNNKFDSEYYSAESSEFASGLSQLSLFVSSGVKRFKFKVGATGVYGFGDDFEEINLFVLPLLDLSYKPSKGNFTPFLRVSGAINQNSFRSLSSHNPYTAPAIVLKNSEVPYAAELGVRTKIVSGWEFKLNGHYQKENNKPLFRNFGFDGRNIDYTAFRYGNSFEVLYKGVEQIGFDASILAAFKNGGSLSFQARWRDYTLEDESEIWNLPELQFDFKANIKLLNKLFVQSNVTYWGPRKNSFRDYFINRPLENANELLEELPSFIDAELKLTYQINDRWELYVKGENVFNEEQFHWANYHVYGTRFILGVPYNFDLNL